MLDYNLHTPKTLQQYYDHYYHCTTQDY